MKAFRNDSCKKMMWNEMNNGRKTKWIDCGKKNWVENESCGNT